MGLFQTTEKNTYKYISNAALSFNAIYKSIPKEAIAPQFETTPEEEENFNAVFLYVVFRAFFCNAFSAEKMFRIAKYGIKKLSEDLSTTLSNLTFDVSWKLFLQMMMGLEEYSKKAISEGTDKTTALIEYYLICAFRTDIGTIKDGFKQYNNGLYQELSYKLEFFFMAFMNMEFMKN